MISSPQTTDTANPKERNGPNANRSPFFIFFNTNINITYPPLANIANIIAQTINFVPRSNPLTAINFMSPPPNTCGMTIANINIGKAMITAPLK